MKEGTEGRAPPQKDPSRERHGIEAGPKPARRSTRPDARAFGEWEAMLTPEIAGSRERKPPREAGGREAGQARQGVGE